MNKIIYFTLCKQILKCTIRLQAMLIPFTFFLSLSLAFKGGKIMYCVTFSEKQEDYDVISWGIPPGRAKSCDSSCDF